MKHNGFETGEQSGNIFTAQSYTGLPIQAEERVTARVSETNGENGREQNDLFESTGTGEHLTGSEAEKTILDAVKEKGGLKAGLEWLAKGDFRDESDKKDVQPQGKEERIKNQQELQIQERKEQRFSDLLWEKYTARDADSTILPSVDQQTDYKSYKDLQERSKTFGKVSTEELSKIVKDMQEQLPNLSESESFMIQQMLELSQKATQSLDAARELAMLLYLYIKRKEEEEDDPKKKETWLSLLSKLVTFITISMLAGTEEAEKRIKVGNISSSTSKESLPMPQRQQSNTQRQTAERSDFQSIKSS